MTSSKKASTMLCVLIADDNLESFSVGDLQGEYVGKVSFVSDGK
jgi:hypothetical protein